MAIINEYNSEEFGLYASQAYTKISSFYVINQSEVEKTISISTETWFNKNSRISGKKSIGVNNYLMTTSVNLFTFTVLYNFIIDDI